jgi:exosortase/archaeosortase family protein
MAKNKTVSNEKQKGHLFRDMKSLKMPLLFCLVAVLLNLLFYVANLVNQEESCFSIELFTARATAGAIHLFGIPAVRENTIIHLTNAVWIVNTECTAVMIMIIFTSFIAVYPASLKAKGIGLLLGLPFIFTANIMRLLLMAVIDRYRPGFSTFFHDYLWQVSFIIMVVFLWMLWMDKVVKREAKPVVSR